MSATLVKNIFTTVLTTVVDTSETTFTKPELVSYYNDGIRFVLTNSPEAHTVNREFSCAEKTMQSLDPNDLALIDCHFNTSLGTIITRRERSFLDRRYRAWHSTSDPKSEVLHFVYDHKTPRQFWLYPCPAQGTQINISVAQKPVDLTESNIYDDDAQFQLDSVYELPVQNYILHRMYAKDDADSQNLEHAKSYLALANSLLGGE